MGSLSFDLAAHRAKAQGSPPGPRPRQWQQVEALLAPLPPQFGPQGIVEQDCLEL